MSSNALSYTNVFVDRVNPSDLTWRRACALLATLSLDSRGFKDSAAPEAPRQLLHRPMLPQPHGAPVPAPYYTASVRFVVSAAFHVRIPLDAPDQLQEFDRAIAEAIGTREFRAQVRYRRLEALRLAGEHLDDLLKRPHALQVALQKYQTRIAELRCATADAGDLPISAAECSALIDGRLTDRMQALRPSGAGLNAFDMAVRQLVDEAEAGLDHPTDRVRDREAA